MFLQRIKSGLHIKTAFFFKIFAGVVVTISILALNIYTHNYQIVKDRILILNNKLRNDISCHFETANDALPSVEDIKPKQNSIFFHETSCIGGLDSRKACAIESAARLHPNKSVYVFFNSPISAKVLNKSCLSILYQFQNIEFARLISSKYAKGTALENLLAVGGNTGSPWLVQHTADMLRFITLYKYGGVYLDTDMIVVKPLDSLGTNWAVRETNEIVNIAAMGFSSKGIGKTLASLIIQDIMSTYRPDLWDYNGSGALRRSLRRICRTFKVVHMTAPNCKGFHVYEPITVYPIHWIYSNYYFKKEGSYSSAQFHIRENKADEIYAHHLWNKISMNYVVEQNSPFEKLARQYCPSIWAAYGHKFGM